MALDTTTEEVGQVASVASKASAHCTKTTTNNNGILMFIFTNTHEIRTNFVNVFLVLARYRFFWWLNDSNNNNNNRGVFSGLFSSSPRPNYRGRLVNPWIPAWTYLGQGSGKSTSTNAFSGGRGDWWQKDQQQKGPPWWSQERYLAQAAAMWDIRLTDLLIDWLIDWLIDSGDWLWEGDWSNSTTGSVKSS